jgi:hypothetical protein
MLRDASTSIGLFFQPGYEDQTGIARGAGDSGVRKTERKNGLSDFVRAYDALI